MFPSLSLIKGTHPHFRLSFCPRTTTLRLGWAGRALGSRWLSPGELAFTALPDAAGETADARTIQRKAPDPRLRTAPSVLTFAFRFPLNPSPSRSPAISPKTRGEALLSSLFPPTARLASCFGNFCRSPTTGTCLSVPGSAGLGHSPESTGLQNVFVRVFGLQM